MENVNDIESDMNSVNNYIPNSTSWTIQGTNKIKEWFYEASLLGNSHNDSAIYFNTLNRSFTVANIVFAALAASSSVFSIGTTSAVNDNEINNNNEIYSESITTTFSLLTVITSGIIATFNWNIRFEFHKIMANEYLDLSKQLECQLSIPIDKREDIVFLLTKTAYKFDEFGYRAPLIPKWIQKKSNLN